MYDSNLGTTALAATGSAASIGLAIGSWVLIAVALIALGGTMVALGRRWQKRNGPKP